MNKPPRYRIKFKGTNYETKKVIEETLEGQYPDSMKTEFNKKCDRNFNEIEMEMNRIDK